MADNNLAKVFAAEDFNPEKCEYYHHYFSVKKFILTVVFIFTNRSDWCFVFDNEILVIRYCFELFSTTYIRAAR